MLSKALAEKLNHDLLELISPNQTLYFKNRCISESVRLITDGFEMSDILGIPSYFVTIDVEKVFDSLDHSFLQSLLHSF